VSDATTDLWFAGYTGGSLDAGTSPGTPADTPADTWPGTPAATQADSEADTPLPVGQWVPAPDETEPAAPVRSPWTHLASLTKGSPLLGGGSLAEEFASPKPDTWTRHWRHVTRHPNRPAGRIVGAGFITGHLAVTAPLKFTGQVMTVTGDALSWAGKRTNRAGDNFTVAVIFNVIAVIVIVILVIAVGKAVSYLP
jgi:hypothetical protein